MRARALVVFLIAILLAGGTGLLVRSWLAQRPTQVVVAPAEVPVPPQRSILVARTAIARGQILKAEDLAWQPWPEDGIDPIYIQAGARPLEAFTGWVARDPIGKSDPITEAKIVAPGSRGFLAAVLRPGMRAVSVPVTATSGISGFVFPGDEVDILVTETLPPTSGNGGAVQHKASETVLHDVRVIAVDQKLDNKGGEAVVAHTATLEVTAKQSEIIAVATEMGKLSLSLRSLATSALKETVGSSEESGGSSTFTMDSEVSRLLPKPGSEGGASGVDSVTILRGKGKPS
jgi:pilus assembly protein CpaB